MGTFYAKDCFLFLFTFLILSACNTVLDSEEAEPEPIPAFEYIQPAKVKNIFYSSEDDLLAVDAYTKSVTISGDIAGKTIYYAQVNRGSSEFSKDYVRYVSSGNGQRAAVESDEVEFHHSEQEHEHILHEFHSDFLPASGLSAGSYLPSKKISRDYENGKSTKLLNILSQDSS